MRRRKEISAELTPLLDVILIILFIIMSGSYKAVEQAEAEKQQAYEEIQSVSAEFESCNDELKKELENNSEKLSQAENIISAYESFDKYAVIMSVGIINKSDNSRDIIISDGSKSDTISYNWDNMLYAENSLNVYLENVIKSADSKPVFISFNYKSNEIYVRDYEMISSVIDNTQGKNKNVYIMYNMEDSQ